MSLVLGVSYAKIIAKLANRTFTYSLPLTNKSGRQLETYEVKKIRHYVQSLDITSPSETILESILGYRIYWDFAYSSSAEGSAVVDMNAILTRHKQGYTLTLIPREDEGWRSFVVIPDNETLSLGINGGGYASTNNSWNFRFITKDLEPDLKLQVAIEDPLTAVILTKVADI